MELPKTREEAERTGAMHLYDTPSHWPRHIQRIPLAVFDNFGRDPKTNMIYWDGDAILMEKRFTWFERSLAIVGLIIGAIGVIATVVQAWAALEALKPPL